MTHQFRLTVLGDRQSGKSHLLMRIAILDGIEGKTVLYNTDTVPIAAIRYQDIIAVVPVGVLYGCSSTTRTIEFDSGGLIVFRAASQYVGERSRGIDTHLIDDCPYMEGRQDAQLVIKAVLR